MCASHAPSVPNRSTSSAMFGAIPLGAFCAAVLALDPLAIPASLPPAPAATLSQAGRTGNGFP